MTWRSQGETYTGDWVKGVQHGVGEHTWLAKRFAATMFVQHNRYVGDFAHGQRHGTGTMYYATGATYAGGWMNNKKHGPAVYTSDTGERCVISLLVPYELV